MPACFSPFCVTRAEASPARTLYDKICYPTRVGYGRGLPPPWSLARACPLHLYLYLYKYFSRSQFGAASARVSLYFAFGRCHGPGCQNAQPRFMAAHTYRYAWRADAIARLPPHKHLDQPVFQRMKRDNDHSSATFRPLVLYPPRSMRMRAGRAENIQHLRQRGFQLFKLAIDGDAQRLKDARSRVDHTRFERHPGGCQLCELRGAGNWPARALPHDTPGDLARAPLFAVAPENSCQFFLAGIVHEVSRAQLLRLIEAHIQRPIDAEREAASRVIHLVR